MTSVRALSRSSRFHRGGVVAVVALALVAGGCGPRWGELTVASPPVTAEWAHARFSDVSCVRTPGSRWCVAVGTQTTGGVRQAFAAAWDGTGWTRLPDPLGGLPITYDGTQNPLHVDCPARDSCVAAAKSPPRLASWDGATWTVAEAGPGAAVPDQGVVSVQDVACGGPDSCVALGATVRDIGVGVSRTSFAETWDGTSWSVSPAPLPDVAVPVNDQRDRLTCTAPTFCLRVTQGVVDMSARQHPVQRWDGTSWSTFADPLRGVPVLPQNPFEGGVPLADPTTSPTDLSVDCVAPDACVATGLMATSGGLGAPDAVVATWNGFSWTRRTLPNARTAASPPLSGEYVVSCAMKNACVIVHARDSLPTAPPPFLAWVGPPWSQRTPPAQPVPEADMSTAISAVSCMATESTCLAVGSTLLREVGDSPVAFSIHVLNPSV
jgi:hypothetical protein